MHVYWKGGRYLGWDKLEFVSPNGISINLAQPRRDMDFGMKQCEF